MKHNRSELFIILAGMTFCAGCAGNIYHDLDENDPEAMYDWCTNAYDKTADDGFNDETDTDLIEKNNTFVEADENLGEIEQKIIMRNYRLCKHPIIATDKTCMKAITNKHCGECNIMCNSDTGAECTIGIKEAEEETEKAEYFYSCKCSKANMTVCKMTSTDTETESKTETYSCRDLENDNNNCGACGKPCLKIDNYQTTCKSGKCLCEDGSEVKDGRCLNIKNDKNNCGKEGNQCLYNTRCEDGKCTQCPDGFIFVKGGAIVTMGSYNHASPTAEYHDGAYDSWRTTNPGWMTSYRCKGADCQSEEFYKYIELQKSVKISNDFCMMQYEVASGSNKDFFSTLDFNKITDYVKFFKNNLSQYLPQTSLTWNYTARLANIYTQVLNTMTPEGKLNTCYANINNNEDCGVKTDDDDATDFTNYCEMRKEYRTSYFKCTGVRMPSEYEWEYAARGGSLANEYQTIGIDIEKLKASDNISESLKAIDNNSLKVITNIETMKSLLSEIFDTSSNNTLKRFDAKVANKLGLHYMTGNVSEWTNDAFPTETDVKSALGNKVYEKSVTEVTDPTHYLTESAEERVCHVIRGCNNITFVEGECRDAMRDCAKGKSSRIGARFVISPIYDENGKLLVK